MYLKEVGSEVIRCGFKVIRSLPETCNALERKKKEKKKKKSVLKSKKKEFSAREKINGASKVRRRHQKVTTLKRPSAEIISGRFAHVLFSNLCPRLQLRSQNIYLI